MDLFKIFSVLKMPEIHKNCVMYMKHEFVRKNKLVYNIGRITFTLKIILFFFLIFNKN